MKKILIGLFILPALAMDLRSSAQETESDAVYRKLLKEYTLNDDGSIDYHFRKELKLLTYFSFHRLFGETFIVYDPRHQQLKINECYTVMADGTKVIAPENSFNEVLPAFARDAVALNPMREMVVTHTGLERGAVITLDYTVHSDAGFYPFLSGSESIGEDVPVEEMQVIVKIPSVKDLKYKMIGIRTAPITSMMAAKEVFIWKFKGLDAMPKESFLANERLPKLFFSAGGDMYRAVSALTGQPAFKEGLSQQLAEKVDAIVKAKINEMEVILALQDLVVDGLKMVEFPLAATGFRIRTAQECWQSAWAGPLEKAVILSKILIRAGINARPVAIVPAHQYDQSMGCLPQFEQFLVQVNPKKEERIYLSVSQKNDQSYSYNLPDKVVIMLDESAESLKTFTEKGMLNSAAMQGELSLEDTSLVSGKVELALTGYRNPYLKILRYPDAGKGLLSGSLASGIKSAVADRKAFERSEWTFEIDHTRAIRKYGTYLFFDLPVMSGNVESWGLGSLGEERTTEVRLPYAVEESYHFEIVVPAGMKLISPQNRIEISNAVGSVVFDLEVKPGKVIVDKKIVLPSAVIEVLQYAAFLELVQAWGISHLKTLVFSTE